MVEPAPGGFVPPPYPYERLDPLRETASQVPGGLVDLSIGTPCDPLPDVVRAAFTAAADSGVGYPLSIGSPALREAASAWMARRLDVSIPAAAVVACVGTKELVASLPHHLHLRDPSRDTVLYPAVAYPTYSMGATLAGCRAVPVPLDDDWHLDLSRVDERDAARALVLWVNEPGNPTGSAADRERLRATVAWARARGIVVASDECYVEFAYTATGERPPPASVLHAGADGVLAVHSLSKRSNMAGMRIGFVAGDGDLVTYLGEVRKHAGFMVPGPVQAAAVAALGDDDHVDEQRARYWERRTLFARALGAVGIESVGGPATFYLWCTSADSADGAADDGWSIASHLARAGTLVSPGELYGSAGDRYVRVALVQPTDRLELAADRLVNAVVHPS